MNAFLDDVATVLTPDAPVPRCPRTRPSRPRPPQVGLGRLRELHARAAGLAELANEVLVARGDDLVVVADFATEEVDGRTCTGFDIRVGAARSRIALTVVGSRAFCRLLGDGLGGPGERELVRPAELEALMLLLVSSRYRDERAVPGLVA